MGPPPSLAIDLPGHGHSDARPDGRYDAHSNAAAIAIDDRAVAPDVQVVVGMSLGGLTATALAATRPDLVDRLVVVDVTPGVDRDKAKEVHDFIAGPQTFPSFREIFDRTVEFNPTRTPDRRCVAASSTTHTGSTTALGSGTTTGGSSPGSRCRRWRICGRTSPQPRAHICWCAARVAGGRRRRRSRAASSSSGGRVVVVDGAGHRSRATAPSSSPRSSTPSSPPPEVCPFTCPSCGLAATPLPQGWVRRA